MLKKTASFLLSLLLCLTLLLTACSTGGQEPSSSESLQDLIAQQGLDPDKETLIYAQTSPSNGTSVLRRDIIDKFNRTHDNVQIAVKDYSNSDGGLGTDLLRTELAVGQLPDIIDLGGSLPYRQLVLKGYLEDLWPYIENDPDLGRDSVLEAPLKAAEVDGKLCLLFGSVSVQTLVGAADQVGDRTSWTVEELQAAFASMPEGSTLLSFQTSRSSILASLLWFSLSSYVDMEAGTSSFDSPGFRSLLEFVSLLPGEDEVKAETAAFGDALAILWESEERLRRGLQMLEKADVSVETLQILDANHGGQCAFIGYPTGDGSVGSMFEVWGPRLAISSACQNKEAAWELVRTVLAEPESFRTPIRKDKYNMRKTAAMHTEAILGISPDTKEDFTVPPVTEEQIQRFEAFFNSIDKINIREDIDLFLLIREICEPYLAGDKTLDETVAMLQNRVGLYLNERS